MNCFSQVSSPLPAFLKSLSSTGQMPRAMQATVWEKNIALIHSPLPTPKVTLYRFTASKTRVLRVITATA